MRTYHITGCGVLPRYPGGQIALAPVDRWVCLLVALLTISSPAGAVPSRGHLKSFHLTATGSEMRPAHPGPRSPESALQHRAPASLASGAARKQGSEHPARVRSVPAANETPIVAVTGTGRGQAGYVHYFLLTGPDGSEESHVGIELDDERIAWSFPDLGVTVSAFIADGAVETPAGTYSVRHLYGLRPFADEAAMARLRHALAGRVATWIEAEAPYCNPSTPPAHLCLSCLGFALHVLFPGRVPIRPDVPADLTRSGSEPYYTTEDLLLYLTRTQPGTEAGSRLARAQRPGLPGPLRDELVRLIGETDAPATQVARAQTDRAGVPAPAAAPARRDAARVVQRRSSLSRRL